MIRWLIPRSLPAALRAAGRPVAAALLAAAFLVLLPPAAAGAVTTPGCAVVISNLEGGLAQLNTTGTTVAPDSPEAKQVFVEVGKLVAAAKTDHPECADDINTYLAKLAAEARAKTAENGTPFLGPIGWLWNNVYYKVFGGNDVMMIVFGWSLLLSPVILVVALRWVTRGATSGMRKPRVPEQLRFDR